MIFVQFYFVIFPLFSVYTSEQSNSRKEVNPVEDHQIVQLYWDRDTAAISATAEKYGRFCSRLALSILGDQEDAEECVNDTYHQTWMTVPPQWPHSLSAYLGRIIKNLSIDRYRRERAKKRFSELEVSLTELEECVPARDSVAEAAELSLLTETINRFLGGLSREKRVIFLRRYWHGQTAEEIARDYGRSKSSIYATLSALRRELRDYLTEEGIVL